MALPDLSVLSNVRRLCQRSATLEIALAYHEELEPNEAARLGLPELSRRYIEGDLARRYREAGFRTVGARLMAREELRSLPSTWARRLAHGEPREVWRLTADALP